MMRRVAIVVFLYLVLTALTTVLIPPPAAVAIASPPRTAGDVNLLVDDSWLTADGTRHLEQEIFDAVFRLIARAEQAILVDMFLFNDWQGPVAERHRALSSELVDALLARRGERPDLPIVLITDPINTVYGGLESSALRRLRDGGVTVAMTDLTKLQDSNPFYSALWRWLIRPFGAGSGELLPNPFGPGRVGLRSWLALLNFKANHRKLVVADDGAGRWQAIVSSANPHDGSSAHRNLALQVEGEIVADLLAAERALLAMSGADDALALIPERIDTVAATDQPTASLQLLNEQRIRDAVLDTIAASRRGDRLDMMMFYLSERRIVTALNAAASRGVALRVILDVNADAFGRQKNGVPNRPVARELTRAGVAVRFCATAGEQCHAKALYWQRADGGEGSLLLGSANFTRRNLDNYNLESDVLLRADPAHPALQRYRALFDAHWANTGERTYTVAPQALAPAATWLAWQYRFMEASGLSTF